jgi:rhamnogalacturonyl hydrolase YesR
MDTTNPMNMLSVSFDKLRRYCETQDFKGYDPYDGLNSPFAKLFHFNKFSLLRLIWIQAFKKSPINLRPLFLIKKEYNPKGIALFLTGYCNLYKITKKSEYLEKIHYLAQILLKLKSKGFSGACWGYNFPWQSRSGFVPKGLPTVVTTSFAAYALMDAFECTNQTQYIDEALSSCQFILKDLKRTKRGEGYLFSYTPLRPSGVYNASLLASRLLSRAFIFVHDNRLLENAKASVLASVDAQRNDGSWAYGELPFQNWVDSFHTGYNLECISEYQKFSRDTSFLNNLEMGFKYYVNNFFLDDGTPKYYGKKIYPIDIHSPTQFIITLYRLNKLVDYQDIANKVIIWTLSKMQDKRKSYFYFQLRKGFSIKIPYMRWGQAWMFYSKTFLFVNEYEKTNKSIGSI